MWLFGNQEMELTRADTWGKLLESLRLSNGESWFGIPWLYT
jgi:hypothetical protein